jgi:hypothetical protein
VWVSYFCARLTKARTCSMDEDGWRVSISNKVVSVPSRSVLRNIPSSSGASPHPARIRSCAMGEVDLFEANSWLAFCFP